MEGVQVEIILKEEKRGILREKKDVLEVVVEDNVIAEVDHARMKKLRMKKVK